MKYLLNNEIESEPVKREDEENKQFLKNMKNNEDSNGIESNVKDEKNNQIDRKIKIRDQIRKDANQDEAKATLDLGKNLGPWQKFAKLKKRSNRVIYSQPVMISTRYEDNLNEVQ